MLLNSIFHKVVVVEGSGFLQYSMISSGFRYHFDNSEMFTVVAWCPWGN